MVTDLHFGLATFWVFLSWGAVGMVQFRQGVEEGEEVEVEEGEEGKWKWKLSPIGWRYFLIWLLKITSS